MDQQYAILQQLRYVQLLIQFLYHLLPYIARLHNEYLNHLQDYNYKIYNLRLVVFLALSTFLFLETSDLITQYLYLYHIMESEKVIIRQQIKFSPQYSGQIVINVEDPLKNQTEAFAFFTYNIEGSDMNGSFTVRRRYKDFDLLRRKLCQRWLGIYIPPISGKRSESNFFHILKKFETNNQIAEAKYAENRKRFLRYFCKGIAVRPYLFYCDLFQIFLRGGNDYQMAINGCLSKQYNFILSEYEANFQSLILMTSTLDFAAVVDVNQRHLRQLRQSQQKLLQIYEAILRNVHARTQFNEQFDHCMRNVIPEYEQKYFLNFVGKDRKKLIIANNEQYIIKLNQFKTLSANVPEELFLQLVAYEIRQTKAFIEAIQGRKQAERRRGDLKQKIQSKQRQMSTLISGGFSFKSMFKTGSKQLQIKQIQMKIEIYKNQLQCIDKMINIMVVNTNYEIEQYKLRRGRQYEELFRTVAQKQLLQIAVYNQLLSIPQIQI